VSNKLVLVVGMGRRRLGLTYVENLVEALVLAKQSNNSYGKTYNIIDPDQPTVRRYIRLYRQITGHKIRALYIPLFLWKVGFTILDGLLRLLRGSSPKLGYKLRSIACGPRYDTIAAIEQIEWDPKVTFKEGIITTYKEFE